MPNEIDLARRGFIGRAAVSIAAARLGLVGMRPMTSDALARPAAGELASLTRATTWLNTSPLSEASLRGKVVLVDFWTYTCINWLRQVPYVRAWSQKYRSHGLVVIGAHAPEFPFEHDLDNVRWAARDMRIEYPVAVDNEFAIWRAFRNRYWPALYLVDSTGRIRYRHFGEGEYDKSERMIQQMLAEAGSIGVGRDRVSVEGRGAEAPADWDNLKSPENYLGYDRTTGFASPGTVSLNKPSAYVFPERLRLHQWAVSGAWALGSGAAVLKRADGRMRSRFHARDLHLVMGPSMKGASVRFRVLIDGKPPGVARGGDIDEQGNGIAREQRMYQLIRQPNPIDDREFEIRFLDPGVEAFAFTFG